MTAAPIEHIDAVSGVDDPVVHVRNLTLRFGGAAGSGINHIINGTGGAVSSTAMSARTPN